MSTLFDGFSMRRAGLAALLAGLATIAALAPATDANVNVSKSGWAWGNPTPQGRTLTSIAFAGGTGYAVGFGGTALSTANAGQSWTGLTTGTTVNLERVQALSPTTVIVGGGGGCVTRISEDGGQVFRRIFNVGGIRLSRTGRRLQLRLAADRLPAAQERLCRDDHRRRRNLRAQDRDSGHRRLERRRRPRRHRHPLPQPDRWHRVRQQPEHGRQLGIHDPRRRRLVDSRQPPRGRARHLGALRR